MQRRHRWVWVILLLLGATPALAPAAPVAAPGHGFRLEQVLAYPFPQELAASKTGNVIAWVVNLNGVRNVWIAKGTAFKPQQVTRFTKDDGQEITQITFSPDGNELVFVRGGDYDANWPEKLPPDPSSSPVEPKVMLWTVDLRDGTSRALTEGDAPAISAAGTLAYVKDDQVWTAPLASDSKDKPKRLFFDRGKDGDLQWSPDGKQLAFVSDRGDHAFIGIYTDDHTPLGYLAPSTGNDGMPRWSPDGTRVAFTRHHGDGGPPRPILQLTPEPWAIWIADARTGKGHAIWQGPDTALGSYPETAGGANLHWADGGTKLVFLADLDGWPHLYSIAASGGTPLLLTPGKFMVEDVVLSRDGRSLVYNANTGSTPGDIDR
ncbi:MAG TPA: hypothetical protein VJ862_10370, partial [Rhodanobacteraceae bacterium]|nr:hypothetical protein [Rhodanobacteraceae bacterium]